MVCDNVEDPPDPPEDADVVDGGILKLTPLILNGTGCKDPPPFPVPVAVNDSSRRHVAGVNKRKSHG